MRWKKPATWVAIASALLVIWLVWLDSGRTSPGPISGVHAQHPDLAGDDCEQCHAGANDSGMSGACNVCHAEIARQIEKKTGFHGTLAVDATRCATCHSEHHGEAFQLVTPQVFALAGVSDPTKYDHAHLAYALEGRHAALACKDCHKQADVELLKRGDKRFLGLAQRCESCHEDVHQGKLPDCAACHGQEHPFKEVAKFVHVASFPLVGAHLGPKCTDCHPKNTQHAIEDERVRASIAAAPSAEPALLERACQECHASPHTERFLAEMARQRRVQPGAACAACHPTAHASFADARATVTQAEHAAAGFALDGPHAKLACKDCHAPVERVDEAVERATFASFKRLYPGRAEDDCAACHGDPHFGQFASGAFAGARCTACHAQAHFTPAAFDVALHDKAAFKLTGAHQAVACGDCHAETRSVALKDKPKLERVFHGTKATCRACHADVHDAQFDRATLPALVEGKQDCERCHDTQSFTKPSSKFDHTRWTEFPLEGAHARAECATCHVPRAKPDVAGRTFGRASERFPGDAARCSTCHADVHAGAFDTAAFPKAVDGREGCARCHSTETFRVAAKEFDHGRWTKYPLEGAHARAACETCHPRAARPDALGRTLGRCAVKAGDAAARCTSCHVDVHAGAFDRAPTPATLDGKTGCVRCHTVETFRVATKDFDHARFTGFALAGAHAPLECVKCHAPVKTRDGKAELQSPARGAACADCHVDPHAAQFARAGRTECASCHRDGPDWKALVFDHQRDARYALDKTHAKVACSACHKPALLPDGSKAVRYKPLGVNCGDCHDPRGAKPR
ncbi:MAG: hypothetical protein HZA53_16480 [Planctomycetes bacterium]|nr:hypothetical protein [Planctomycetota bacterium]